MSDAGREPGQSPDSQETISDNNLAPEIAEKEISKNLLPDDLQTSKGFSGNPDLSDSNCYLESSESDCHSSDSDYISSPTSYDNNPQTEKKRKLSGTFSVSDNFGRTEKNLERSDKRDLRSKFISGATISENPLTSQDRKFSEKTSDVSTVLNYNDPLLAADDTNSNIYTNTINRASVAVSLGDGTGNMSRNLRPRQHMDKLSE